MVFATRTIVVAMVVGTVVTLIAGLIPAWRATRVAPVEALRSATPGAGRVRLPARAVRAVASLLGRPAQAVGGAPGGLARRNAMRQPGRTMMTAAALAIGVALVTLVTVVATGLKDTTRGELESAHRRDATSSPARTAGRRPTRPCAPRSSAAGCRSPTVRQDRGLAFGDKETVNAVDGDGPALRLGARRRQRPRPARRGRRGRRRGLGVGARPGGRRPVRADVGRRHEARPDRARDRALARDRRHGPRARDARAGGVRPRVREPAERVHVRGGRRPGARAGRPPRHQDAHGRRRSSTSSSRSSTSCWRSCTCCWRWP